MAEATPPLTPLSLTTLLGRIDHEWSTRKKIFDLPSARIWKPDPGLDLGFDFLGRRCASPIGPAAGPHSQLASNIVLSWLGGSRLFELKTVQILDELEIARPCIDMETIGYNIEWSQELKIAQSLTEYVKSAMLIDILGKWEPIAEHLGPDPGPHVFDMSVGYDLAGISSPEVGVFLKGMRNAAAEIEKLRPEIGAAAGGAFASLADLPFATEISNSLTLSTFHGCPPDEIEAITKYLIDDHDLDVIVKLNPTLLGYDQVADVINGQLGYTDVSVKESAFEQDLQFERGIALIGELHRYAKERGRKFGIKLTNTLVVDNTRGFMPDETMYLSGAPLHVLASALLEKLSSAMPGVLDIPGHDGEIMVSFSAGVTKSNLTDTLAMGVQPATVCSDLLKPGGYGRLAPMLKALATDVKDGGHTNLVDWKNARQQAAVAAGFSSTAEEHVTSILGDAVADYHLDGNSKLPRAVDNDLEMFGCVACNLCVTVCPNDAFTSIKSLAESKAAGMESRQQYLLFSELCNECGNCMVFCPENGDPAQIKPRLYTDVQLYADRADQGQAFLIADGHVAEARADDESIDLVQQLLTQQAGNPFG